MPELPDIVVYRECLEARARGAVLEDVRLQSPFLLRTVEPPLPAALGRPLRAVRRLGKRLVLELSDSHFLVLHLMVAGRLHWRPERVKLGPKLELAAFDFAGRGTLVLTEAGSKRRASLHHVVGEAALAALDPGGLEALTAAPATFAGRVRAENHTLKRALTDPRLFSGIGNAYSDEILHRARLSPVRLTSALTDAEVERLHAAVRAVLTEWTERLRAEAAAQGGWPQKVTAFRPEMAVHGRYREPCPVCGAPVQHIVYADNETNYCPGCQTQGRLLSDRSLARLLRDDWPRNLAQLDELTAQYALHPRKKGAGRGRDRAAGGE